MDRNSFIVSADGFDVLGTSGHDFESFIGTGMSGLTGVAARVSSTGSGVRLDRQKTNRAAINSMQKAALAVAFGWFG